MGHLLRKHMCRLGFFMLCTRKASHSLRGLWVNTRWCIWTSGMKRFDRERRRRMQVVSIFPNEESVIRLIAALLIETHEDYANSNRYNNIETILALAPEEDVYRIRRCSSLFHLCGRRNRPGEYHFKNRPPAAPEPYAQTDQCNQVQR